MSGIATNPAVPLDGSWHAGLQPMHWRILAARFRGWILGCAYAWMAIYPAELFTSSVRSTASSFICNATRLIACWFPILAGTMIQFFGGIPRTAVTLGLIYVVGSIVPWFLPETKGRPLPE